MLAKTRMCTIPANADLQRVLLEESHVCGGTPKRIVAELCGFSIGTPKQHPNVHSTPARSRQHLEERTATVRHFERGPKECYGDPDARLGLIDCVANPPKCRF